MHSNSIVTISVLLFASVALISFANCEEKSPSEDVPKIFDYGKYVEKFKKAYNPVETMNKAKLFFGRTLKIFHHNVQYKSNKMNYFLGQNQFTDMTTEELKRFKIEQDDDMRLVDEAKQNPDLPASSSMAALRFTQQGEGESSASIDDLDQVKLVKKTKAIVDFMEDDNKDAVGDLKTVLNRIKSSPHLTKQMEQVIEAENKAHLEQEQSELERAVEKNKIAVKPIPPSTNKHYDMDSIVSYGSGRQAYEEFAENYAKYLMDDPILGGINMMPYDTPAEAKNRKPKDEDDSNVEISNPLINLMGSMKSIYDFFTLDGYDESQDQDSAPTSVEKPKDNGQNNNEITYDIDWRKTGCLNKPKNQKDCNSCYAFATLGLMEYFHCMQTKQLTDFSPQYVVDCGLKNDMHGCQGGKLSSVGQFIRKYGIELDNTYPYTGREGQCSIVDAYAEKAGYLKPQITAWQSFPSIGAWYKWLPRSPILVGVSMPSDFFGYAGGIHDGSNCEDKAIHALLLVGSGKQDGKEFWLLKNSYSDEWGENGYFRISKAAPMRCFNSAVVARAKFVP